MSLASRLRRLEARVHWLETEGMLRHITAMMKTLERMQEISDRLHADPALAARWKRDFPGFPCRLPPPSALASRVESTLRDAAVPAAPQGEVVGAAPPQPEAEAHPHPEERREAVRLEGCERASADVETPPVEPTLRDAASPAALQGEVVPVDPPEPRPPPDMQIRPVFWRPRGEYREGDDEDDITSGTLGRCLTEYDPLAGEDDDDE